MSVCVSLFLIILAVSVSLQLSTWLCPSACFSVSLLTLLHSTTVIAFFPVSSSSHSPVLVLFSALLLLGGCSSPTGQPGDTLGHCLGSPSRSPPHARHLGTASIFLLQLWGVGGGYSGGKTQCPVSICSGALGPLTLSAAIKGAGSQGSEMIMIASAKQPRSRQPLGE